MRIKCKLLLIFLTDYNSLLLHVLFPLLYHCSFDTKAIFPIFEYYHVTTHQPWLSTNTHHFSNFIVLAVQRKSYFDVQLVKLINVELFWFWLEKKTRSSTPSPLFYPTATPKSAPQKIIWFLKARLFYVANTDRVQEYLISWYYSKQNLIDIAQKAPYWDTQKVPSTCNSLPPTYFLEGLLILQVSAL